MLGLGSGCASNRGSAFDRQLFTELQEENTRLESRITQLQEEKLRRRPKSACQTGAEEGHKEDSTPSSTPETELTVVKMGPEEEPTESTEPVVSVRPAAPVAEEDDAPPGTRPVLKVRGEHEAWVYHRPLTAEDDTAKAAEEPEPAPPSKKSKPAREPSSGK